MYKNAIEPYSLEIRGEGKAYVLRHLFSGVESWLPAKKTRSSKRDEHSHDVYHLVLYTRGRGLMNLLGKELPFKPGFLVLCGPGEAHKFGAHDDCACEVEYRNFTFELVAQDGERLKAGFKELLESLWHAPLEGFARTRELSSEEISELLRALDAALALKLGHERVPGPDAAGCVLNLLGKLWKLSSRSAEERASQPPPDERLLRAKSLVEKDSKGELDLETLAKAASLSRSQFLRAFKSRFGETPMRLSRKLRLERAKGMLACSSLGEKAIAYETGFCDEFHLSKLFKAEYGEAPSIYRRRLAAGRS